MEKLQQHSKKVFDLLDAHRESSDVEFNNFTKKLDDIYASVINASCNVERTPQRTKKKPKQVPATSTDETAAVRNSSAIAAASSVNTTASTTTTDDTSMFRQTTDNNTTALMTSLLNDTASVRPSRHAAVKAKLGLKEPSLTHKMRNEVTIKMERITIHETQEPQTENDPNAANRPTTSTSSTEDRIAHATARLSLKDNDQPKQQPPQPQLQHTETVNSETSAQQQQFTNEPTDAIMDESLIVLPAAETETVSLMEDDDETPTPPTTTTTTTIASTTAVEPVVSTETAALLMPPPAMPAPAPRKPRTKKQPKAAVIKKEKLSLAASAEEQEEHEQQEMPPPVVRSTRSKKVKPGAVPLPIQEMHVIVKSEPIAEQQTETAATATAAPLTANTTQESVYEDASTDVMVTADASTMPQQQQQEQQQQTMDSANATYISEPTVDNATYIASNDNNATYIAPPNAAAAAASAGIADAEHNQTYDMVPVDRASADDLMEVANTPPPKSSNRATPSMASIMTEDNSDDEVVNVPLPAPIMHSMLPVKNKNHKELFNPCVQSPLKQKVQAFERAAAASNMMMDTQSPAPVRQTRTKTRLKTANSDSEPASAEGIVQKVHQSLLKAPSTPNLNWKTGCPVTPRSAAPTTPATATSSGSTLSLPGGALRPLGTFHSAQAGAPLKRTVPAAPSSANSKLAHLNRTNSAEEVRRGMLDLVEEKRRKREEKLRQVQLQRELREKERADKYAKQLADKEEKARAEALRKQALKERKDREAENKRALEEIQRNLKVQALRDAEKARLEREMLEAERKEREQLDLQRIQVEKLAMQQKFKHNQLEKARKVPQNKYTFDMLNTDDETDSDDRPASGRPPPPEWSIRGFREERISSQSHLHHRIIDGFFSSHPMSPDLQELFPNISDKHLKRNSSAVWATPPRYSTMDMPRYPK